MKKYMKKGITLFVTMLVIISIISGAESCSNKNDSFTSSPISNTDQLLEHPRLLFTNSEESNVKSLIETDAFVNKLASYIKEEADSIVELEQLQYKLDDSGALLWTSRAYVYRLGTLSLAYRIYGENKYLEAANEALLWICNFPDWHPSHFLDTAEMTTAVAIAYDWLYNELPETIKILAKICIYNNAISKVLEEYKTGGNDSWAKRETNWNVVCNTGMVLGALAVAEDYPNEVETILTNAAKYIPNCLKLFAPEGVCYEGPMYWGYTHKYLSMYLKAVMDNGGDNGNISQLPGISNTALYMIRSLTPSGKAFCFGDAGVNHDFFGGPCFFLYGKIFNQPEVSSWNRKQIEKFLKGSSEFDQTFFLSLPWYDNSSIENGSNIPKLEIYHNEINDIIIFNGDRNKNGSIYLEAKGGLPSSPHQQMDCGTFIIESDSILWTIDLGIENYNLPGFWDYKPGGRRWSYFRNSNFSHNVINIDKKLQYANGHAYVCEENTISDKPYAKLDLSEVYKEQSKSTYRKFTLLDDYTIEIEDEIDLLNVQSEISWIIATEAQIEIDCNKVHLMQNGKHFYIEMIYPANSTFITYPAKKTHPNEYTIKGINMIEGKCRFNKKADIIKVRMSSKKLW